MCVEEYSNISYIVFPLDYPRASVCFSNHELIFTTAHHYHYYFLFFSYCSSEAKYDSGSGWPSFHTAEGEVITHTDRSFLMVRTEVLCGEVRRG